MYPTHILVFKCIVQGLEDKGVFSDHYYEVLPQTHMKYKQYHFKKLDITSR